MNNQRLVFSPAILALADGSVFQGISVGQPGIAVGEVVFNTAMTGYQEIISDPSYAEQLITFTCPHIGNVGMNSADQESDRPEAKGIILRDLSPIVSNWRAEEDLTSYLIRYGLVAIAGVDTRRLTRLLREKGAQNGCIMTDQIDAKTAIANACAFTGLENLDLAKKVCSKTPYLFCEGREDRHLVVYDFGVKRSILQALAALDCKITVVPAEFPAKEVLAMRPQGVVLSNGPGDPAACEYAIDNARIFLAENMPLLGICLGCQILGLALGAKTFKMKLGHHGANHPVQALETGRVFITSQNHGFAIDENSLPEKVRVTHRSLFDHTVQGIAHLEKPVWAFQGHPEAGPGPLEMKGLFAEFIQRLN